MNSSSLRSPHLLVRYVRGVRQRVRILAAIGSLDSGNSELAEHIVTRAAQLAQELGGEIHVVSAYPRLSADTRSYRVERYLPALRVKLRGRHRSAVRQLLRRLNVAVATIHVEEGEARQVIEALASSLQASVVVEAAPASDSSKATIDAAVSARSSLHAA